MGYKETKEGLIFDKEAYGYPITPGHDYPNKHRGQDAKLKTPPVGSFIKGSILKDGFTVIPHQKIEPPNQARIVEKFQDPKHKSSRSRTASAFNKEHFKKGE